MYCFVVAAGSAHVPTKSRPRFVVVVVVCGEQEPGANRYATTLMKLRRTEHTSGDLF